jgi:HEAT repeat protein
LFPLALSDDRAVQAAVEALQDGMAEVRRRAAWALGRLGGREAVMALRQALQDSVASVRTSAREALARLGAAEDEEDY